MVCNRIWHLPRIPLEAGGHPARLIKEGRCVDLSMDIPHLKYPLVCFGFEGSALTLPPFLLSPRVILLCPDFCWPGLGVEMADDYEEFYHFL